MNIQHFEKGLTYSENERLIMARKIGKLATYCEKLQDEDSSIRIESERRETKKSQDEVKVMVTVILPKKTFRAESRRNKVIDAFDRVMKKITPQLKRYKEEHTGRQKAHMEKRRER